MDSFAETQSQLLKQKGENRYKKKIHIGIALRCVNIYAIG